MVLRLLTPLLNLPPDPENFTVLMAFCGRTWPHIKPLVERRDPRALLLLSYWFALLKQIDQWWVVQRAKFECVAVVRYLSELQDPKISRLLAYPASFGQADLSYIWEPPIIRHHTSIVLQRYFQKGIRRSTSSLAHSSIVSMPQR